VDAAETHNLADWTARISTLRSEAEVVHAANDFLSTWPRTDLQRLPARCRIERVESSDQLAEAALAFVNCELHLAHDSAGYRTVAQLARIFIAAQLRVRQIRGRQHDPASS
jgi:hypothetical protein